MHVVHARLVDDRESSVGVDAGGVPALHLLADVEVLRRHLLAGGQVGRPPLVSDIGQPFDDDWNFAVMPQEGL